MSNNLINKLAYVGRENGKIVSMCTAEPDAAAEGLPQMLADKLTITLEDRQEAKAEWMRSE